ncbi:MAG: hypothetical protein ACK554_12815, partial [Erythrobacteraceae bacterium]
MGRTIIAAFIALGMLAGCTDWREGEETFEACEKRFALKKGAVHPLADDPGQWVASFTYDITKLGGEGIRALVKTAKDGAEPGTVGLSVVGSGSSQIVRDKFADLPATEAGAVLMADDPSLYKVRGKPSLYRDLLRQGCEGQRAGMRLVSMSFYREDALADGELPLPEMTAT